MPGFIGPVPQPLWIRLFSFRRISGGKGIIAFLLLDVKQNAGFRGGSLSASVAGRSPEESRGFSSAWAYSVSCSLEFSIYVRYNRPVLILNDSGGQLWKAKTRGCSGALLTGATLLVGRIKGIDRPAISPMLPAYKGQFMLMDAGANTNCKPINLLQFAQMASIYLSKILSKISKVIILLT